MTDILRLTKRFTPATILADLNSPTGANNAGIANLKTRLVSIDRGDVTKDLEWFEPSGRHGDRLVFSRYGRAGYTVVIRAEGTSGTYESLRNGYEALVALLEDGSGRQIHWLADGGAAARYIDYETSEVARLLSGQTADESERLLRRGVVLELPLFIYTDPAERVDGLDPAVNKLVNPTLLLDVDLNGTPDGWAWGNLGTSTVTSESIDAATESYKATVTPGTGSARLRQSANSGRFAASPGQVFSFSGDARVDSGTGAQIVVYFIFWDSTPSVLTSGVSTQTRPLTFTRLSFTTPPAPANTAWVEMGFQYESSPATAQTGYHRRAQLEQASAASLFRVPFKIISLDPSVV